MSTTTDKIAQPAPAAKRNPNDPRREKFIVYQKELSNTSQQT